MAPSIGAGRDFTQSSSAGDTQPSAPGDGGWNE